MRSAHLAGRLTRPAAFAVIVACAAVLPSVALDRVWQGIALQVAINACAALGMTLLFGFAGQLAVAQAVFMGCGAYAMIIVGAKTGISPWFGLPLGVGVAVVLAAVIGYPVLRLHGLYLAMATLALNIALVAVVTEEEDLTGGAIGLQIISPLSFFGRELFEPIDLYYFTLASLVVLFVLAHRLVRSPIGSMLAALRRDERAASLSGIHTSLLKTKVFVVSAAFGAVGGFWFASQQLFVSPESFGIIPSFLFLVMVVIGGVRSLTGAVLGAAFIVIVPQVVPDRPREQEFIFALTFLLVVMLAPRGLAGIAQDAWRYLRQAGRRDTTGRPSTASEDA